MTWWLYRLTPLFSPTATDLLSEGAGYVFQILGLLLVSLLIKKRPDAYHRPALHIILAAADLVFCAAAFFLPGRACVLTAGFLMNLTHGMLFGCYLTFLSLLVPQQRRGLVFGAAYGAGSIGSWLVSLFFGGTALGSPYIFVLYALLAAAVVWLSLRCAGSEPAYMPPAASLNRKVLLPAAAAVVLLSLIKGLGFWFPNADLSALPGGAAAVRAFYAVGLIAAGLINDRSRKWGAVACLSALAFPFFCFALRGEFYASAAMWIAGYVFFGFFSVYRAVLFADCAAKKAEYLPLAGLGLMFGRVGDVAGMAAGTLLSGSPALLWVAAALLCVTVPVFFRFYDRTYAPVLSPDKSLAQLREDFREEYRLSAREGEVFALVADGLSNSEIAAALYISENTVKFHVKSILKKTGCQNRTGLIFKFRRESGC